MLQLAGVQLVPFSPLHDQQLPPGLAAVLIGGGAVADHAAQLSHNRSMLEALRAFAHAGGLVIGEAGGLMYLSKSLQQQQQQHGQRHAMGECEGWMCLCFAGADCFTCTCLPVTCQDWRRGA